MRDLTKEFTIPNGVNTLNATASLDPFFGPFESVNEAYNLVPENKRKVGKPFAIYLDSTNSNVKLYYWITNSAGSEWRVIPQLPDIDTDRVVSLGAITVNGSVVTIGLPSGGANIVEINNAIYSRYESIRFTTDAIISAGNFRKDIIEARADSTVFYLKKGVESTNAVPPAVTEDALFISEVLVTSTGVSAGALNSVVTDSTMKGDGTSGNPLGLSDYKNAEIAGKTTMTAVQTWVSQRYLQADSAVYAGFVNTIKERPYIRHSDMTVVELATNAWVTTQTTPATQAEVEASTGTHDKPTLSEPATEDRKFLSLFNFFKLIKKLRYIHLLPNSAPAVANRLWSDGKRVNFDNDLAFKNTIAYTSDLPTTFEYTPTGNFTTSQLKDAAEKAGLIFNGLHFFINISTNNYICTIDNGAKFPRTIITIGIRRVSGTSGSISFESSRTLNAGTNNITILNGNENSIALVNLGTSQDLLNINNQ